MIYKMSMYPVRIALASASGVVLALGFTPPAFAHSELVGSVPSANESARGSPSELRLSFSEPIEPAFTKVKMEGPNKHSVDLGKPTLDPANTKVVVVDVDKPLAAGTFAVEWSVVSTDGHKSSGNYTFTVK